jgi:hypothetical protein
MRIRKSGIFLSLLLLVSGCSILARRQLAERFGPESPRERVVPAALVESHPVRYWRDVKPIIDSRCVVCHSCYDSPCQLNLASIEGLDRGANKNKVYADRLVATNPTRLFIDAHSTAEWREMDFYPMLNEREQTAEANLESSVLYRSLALKERNPQPRSDQLPSSFDLSLSWASQCPRIEEMEAFEKKLSTLGNALWVSGAERGRAQDYSHLD